MQYKQALALLALLLVAGSRLSFAQDDEVVDVVEEVEEEKAFLILRKSVVDREHIANGVPFTVEIEIHNAGTSSALDVEVEDSVWPSEQFSLSSGSSSWSSPRVKAGATAKYSYEVTPSHAGYIQATPATATYRDLPDATYATVVTSSTPHIFINSSLQKYKTLALRVGTYVSFGSLRTPAQWRNVAILLGLVAVAVGGQSVYKSVTDKKKQTRYQKALEEVNKMK